MNWIQVVLTWYLYLFVLGIVFMPLTKRLFGHFFDYGYPFAKTIGIILFSYLIFLLGIFKIVPFSRETLIFSLLIIAFLLYRKSGWKGFLGWTKEPLNRKVFWLVEEVLFLIALFFLTFIRGQEPSIRGLEKFMDYGFMQSILRSEYFPPLDMWLSADPSANNGYPINYYYFGHLTGALLIKLSNTVPSIGYNLVLATIFAQGITLSFSLTANIVYLFKKIFLKAKSISTLPLILYGLIGGFIVNLGGNLHTIYLFTRGYPNESPIPFWTIFQSLSEITKNMTANNQDFFTSIFSNSKYWYPNATRFIPFTIHEFPAYSYVVADLHGHVFDIPFVLLTLAVIFSFFVRIKPPLTRLTMPQMNLKAIRTWIAKFRKTIDTSTLKYMVLFGFLTAIHYMTNAFDGPIYLLLIIFVLFILFQFSVDFFVYAATLAISFYIFAKPFSHFFSPFVSGIGVNCSPQFLVNLQKLGPFLFEKDNCQVSPVWMLPVLWGFFWVSAVLLGIVLWIQNKRKTKAVPVFTPIDFFAFIIFAFGTFLILIPEFFYIKDIYPAHFRANTMFKMGYQAFMMMGIFSAYVLYRIKQLKGTWKFAPVGVYLILFILIFLYPFFAFPSYYPGLYDGSTYRRAPELDGIVWLKNQYPEDLEIINYLNTRVPGQPIILEAQGDSYTDYERISAYTGLPTVAGWWVHEWLWRGSADVVGNRIPDITNMYESEDYQLTKSLLKKYHVSYVVVSGLEKSKYPNIKEEKFNKLGVKIFESNNGSGALYQIK